MDTIKKEYEMREIKFKAWDGKEMILPPFELVFIKKGHIEVHKDNEDDINTIMGCTGRNCRCGNGLILIQYTGLKDFKSVDIYEGDIVSFTDQYGRVKSFVEFYNGQFGLWRNHNEENDVFLPLAEICIEHCKLKIIGNIHKNLELLRKIIKNK